MSLCGEWWQTGQRTRKPYEPIKETPAKSWLYVPKCILMEEPPSSARADVTVYATVDMLQRVEQNLDTRIAQLAAGTEVSKLGQKSRRLQTTSLSKNLQTILHSRNTPSALLTARGHQLSRKEPATAITSCRTSFKRIDSLSSALDQQHVIVSKQNSHDQGKVVNRLESKIQRRFHTLRDDVYEEHETENAYRGVRSLPQIA